MVGGRDAGDLFPAFSFQSSCANLATLDTLAVLVSLAYLDVLAVLKRSSFRNAGQSGAARYHQVHSGTL